MTDTRDRAVGLRLAQVLLAVLAVGSVLMSVAHTGVRVPLLSAIGPPGGTVVWQASAGFAAAAAGFAAALAGLAARRRWGFILAILVLAATLLAASVPLRGPGSILGITLTLAALGALATPSARAALRPR